jgi:hypothetical protein
VHTVYDVSRLKSTFAKLERRAFRRQLATLACLGLNSPVAKRAIVAQGIGTALLVVPLLVSALSRISQKLSAAAPAFLKVSLRVGGIDRQRRTRYDL